jgi:hypothetical protein
MGAEIMREVYGLYDLLETLARLAYIRKHYHLPPSKREEVKEDYDF